MLVDSWFLLVFVGFLFSLIFIIFIFNIFIFNIFISF